MGPRVLVSFPDACEASAALAGPLSAILRERSLDSRVMPFQFVTQLEGFDAHVLGCSLGDAEPLAELARFAESHADELADAPVALFALAAAGAEPGTDAQAQLQALRGLLAPLTVGRFDGSDPGNGEARRWAAQLAWTLTCAARPLAEAEPPWHPAALAVR